MTGRSSRRPGAPYATRSALVRFLVAGLLAGSALVSSALAFETLGRWPVDNLRYRLNPNFPVGGSVGTASKQEETIVCGDDVWEDQTRADFELRYEGRTTIARIADDGINAVFWADADGEGALAATFLALFGPQDTIAHFDIVFFSETGGMPIEWSTSSDPSGGVLDIGGVATHELGHALGLDHTPISAATMFAAASGTGIHLRTLHPDDRDGIESLYDTVAGAPEPAVEVTSVEPTSGPAAGGNTITIFGSNFTYDSDTEVLIDGLAVARSRWRVESCGEIRIFDMPAGLPGSVAISVRDAIGSATLGQAYRYGLPAPELVSVEPTSAPLTGGTMVTVTGVGFRESAVVEIDGRPLVDPLFVDSETITGTVPETEGGGGFVDVRLVQGDDVVELVDAFFYNSYALAIGRVAAPPGTERNRVPLTVSAPEELQAASVVVAYDPDTLAIQEVDAAPAESLTGAPPGFSRATIDPESGTLVYGVVFRLVDEPNLPAGDDRHFADVVFDVDPTAEIGAESPLRMLPEGGDPPVMTIVNPAPGGEQIFPLRQDGVVLVAAGVSFIRGDSNGDDTVDVSDPIHTLNHLFAGGPAPTCDDAADSNDDGDVNISDPVRTLTGLFGGAGPLPPPGPEPGVDPTPDDLSCEP